MIFRLCLLSLTTLVLTEAATQAASCDGKAKKPSCSVGPEAKSINEILANVDATCEALCNTPGANLPVLNAGTEDNILGPLLENVGQCYQVLDKNNRVNEKKWANLGTAHIAPDLAQRFSRIPPIKKCNGQMATVGDVQAIDIMARTLFGEIGGNPKCVPDFDTRMVKAIASVILNRKNTLGKKAWAVYADRLPANGENPVIPIVLNSDKFNAWDPGNDPFKTIACPPREAVSKIKNAAGKVQSSNRILSGTEMIRWQSMVDVAKEAILCEEKFSQSIKGTPAYQYTMNPSTHTDRVCNGYTLLDDVRVDGQAVNDVKCVELWQEPANSGRWSQSEKEDHQRKADLCINAARKHD